MADVLIDPPCRLSDSLLWQIQRCYFEANGLRAWQTDEVPSQISSNPVMARAYSRLVLSFLMAQYPPDAPLPNEPVSLVELGAGSGRLAYHFLQEFLPLLADSRLAELPIRYVLTDFVQEIVDFWRGHPLLAEWLEAGVVDVALFDAVDPRPSRLQQSGGMISAETPIILLANYFFDTIPQDSFSVEAKSLHESKLALISTQPEPDLADPALWQRLDMVYETDPAEQPIYENEIDNELLMLYANELITSAVTFPNVGLACLRFWQRQTRGNLLLLSADRGHTTLDSLDHQPDPIPNLHGSFSLMVNYHALTHALATEGWHTVTSPHYHDHIQTVAAVCPQDPTRALDLTAFDQTFHDVISVGGPNDLFAVKQAAENGYANLSLGNLLSLLRVQAYDADVFVDMAPALLAHLADDNGAWVEDVYSAAHAVWQRYFPLGGSIGVGMALGRVLAQLGCFDEALTCLEEAQAWAAGTDLGRDAALLALIDLCTLGLVDPQQAQRQLPPISQ